MEVYVMGARRGPKKVGLATNPRSRLNTVQTGHSRRIELLLAIEVPDNLASDIERRAHWLLRESRTHGEWFGVTGKVAIEAVRTAVAESGVGEKARSAVGRPPLNTKSATKPVLVRLTEEQAGRIDALAGPNKRAVFIREAVDREIKRREKSAD